MITEKRLRHRASKHNKRAKQKGKIGHLTTSQLFDAWIHYTDSNGQTHCCYCDEVMDGKDDAHIDTTEHLEPLCCDGHSTAENILPACKSCNNDKGGQTLLEWYPYQDFYSTFRMKQILKHQRKYLTDDAFVEMYSDCMNQHKDEEYDEFKEELCDLIIEVLEEEKEKFIEL